jgi:microcystin-dependent protein
MADKQKRQQLYEWFETGDRPSQLQFEDFIDSGINQHDDDVWVDDSDVDGNGAPNAYQGNIGIGNREPVAKLAVSGEVVIGGGFANDRLKIGADNIPDNGLVVEGGLRIGTYDDNSLEPYKVVIKNQGEQGKPRGNKPLTIDSDNHDMIVFNDTDTGNGNSDPYMIRDETSHGFRLNSGVDGVNNRESVRINSRGMVGINLSVAGTIPKVKPSAQLDIEAEGNIGLRVKTTHNDAIRFDGKGNATPFTLLDEADRGFRFVNQIGTAEHLRIKNDGNVGIGETDPTYKLQVDGDIALNPNGNIYGKHLTNPLKIHANSTSIDGAYLELHPSDATSTTKGEMNLVTVGDSEETGWAFKQQHLFGGPLVTRVQIKKAGMVGINLPLASGSSTNYEAPSTYLDVEGSTGSSQTGLRLRTGAMDRNILSSDGQGNASWVAMGAFLAEGVVPPGAIIMWSGTTDKNALLVMGWALCDGDKGPDLRGRFIVAYDDRGVDPGNGAWHSSYTTPGNMGGVNDVILKDYQMPKHDHDLSAPLATTKDSDSHKHSITELIIRDGVAGINAQQGVRYGDAGNYGAGGYKTDPGGVHSHELEGVTDEKGGDLPHENRPPYYVLAYIIKL